MAYEKDLGKKLVETLPSGVEGLYNPWADSCAEDLEWNTASAKLARLEAHLDCEAKYILCGEAQGYQGARYSGVAFTSESQLIEGVIPRITSEQRRLTKRRIPFREPSATIVWRKLYLLGIAEKTINWNSVQLHPHRPGVSNSNRTPSKEEILLGKESILMLRDYYPEAIMICVGKKSEWLFKEVGIKSETIRHPANGGATLFEIELAKIVEKNGR